MKANRIPIKQRLENRIRKLYYRYEDSRSPSPSPGNPYWYCKGCGKHDPEISISGHGKHCPFKGILKEIQHYKTLLEIENL